MLFTSIKFVAFFCAVLLIFWCVPHRVRWLVLLTASIIFYWTFSGILVLHIVLISLIAWGAALLLTRAAENRRKRRALLWLAVLLIIGSWMIFKFYNPSVDTLGTGWAHILLPVGISFYSLSVMSYVIDVYNKTIEYEPNPLRVLLFASFFPALIQGPINRYGKIGNALRCNETFDYSRLVMGFERILYGYFKKLVIADRLYAMTSLLFANYADYSGFAVFAVSILYKIQLYCDFSGGIDIAIGLAEMLGIELDENFNLPFFSKSVSEYWRKWHITLGAWLKDYIFYPLTLTSPFIGLSKKLRPKSKTASKLVPSLIAMAVLWLCSAVWHGEGVGFLLWGFYNWIFVALDTVFEKKLETKIKALTEVKRSLINAGRMLLTFLIVCFSELIFNAKSVTEMAGRIGHMFTRWSPGEIFGLAAAGGLDHAEWIVLAAALMLLFAFEYLLYSGRIKNPAKSLSSAAIPLRWAVLLLLFAGILVFGYYGPGYNPAPFIYFQF